jgi:cyanophycinase-like exopeptidase
MKLFLFGGAEISLNQVPLLKDLIKETIVNLNPKTVLLVPFARLHPTEEDWKEGWFKEIMKDTGIKILDARNKNDIKNAINPVIFINGGHERYELIVAINNNKPLLNLILNANYIVAESAGSMIMGECFRRYRAEEGDEIVKGLGILKQTVIEPHYSERNSRQLLLDEMKRSNMKYGLGIDCATAIVVESEQFPTKFDKIGSGNVYLETN